MCVYLFPILMNISDVLLFLLVCLPFVLLLGFLAVSGRTFSVAFCSLNN